MRKWEWRMEMRNGNGGMESWIENAFMFNITSFYGCLCTFCGLSVSGNSSLSHSPVEIQQYLCAFHIYNSILLICQQHLFLKHEWWKQLPY